MSRGKKRKWDSSLAPNLKGSYSLGTSSKRFTKTYTESPTDEETYTEPPSDDEIDTILGTITGDTVLTVSDAGNKWTEMKIDYDETVESDVFIPGVMEDLKAL